jgi:hypothetical protein
MVIANTAVVVDRANRFLQSSVVRNLHSQAHARAILRNVGRNADDWPNFRVDLDERLHHAAHSLLWSALERNAPANHVARRVSAQRGLSRGSRISGFEAS